MSRKRMVIIGGLTGLALATIAWIAIELFMTAHRIPEAYAAWDTARLIIVHLKTHDDQWPDAWDDLLAIVENDEDRSLTLYGAQAGDLNYARSLRRMVRVDWEAISDELRAASRSPGQLPFQVVTRLDGSDFPTVWEGAEPNELIWRYLNGLLED